MADLEVSDRVINMAAVKAASNPPWFDRLARSEKGWLPTIANALIIFANDPVVSGLLSYDAFVTQHFLMRAPPPSEPGAKSLPGPYPRVWGKEDVALVQAYMQRVWSSRFSRPTIEDAMLTAAAISRYHPVTDWLDGLLWDKKPRLDFWLTNAFGVENNSYHRAISAKFMIAAVRRVRVPGTKFDYMPVLEGKQGIGKSRSVRALFGAPWFSDSIPSDLTSKDTAMALLGVWCLEFAEIEHLIRAEVETIKAFLSRSTDRYRPPYEKAYVDRPRQGVLIGTTNADDYLRDSTGNRRIWPVRCLCADVEWIEMHREQLWAEAVYRERRGETIWLDDDDVNKKADAAQSQRMSEDVWADAISAWVPGRAQIKVPQVLNEALNIPKERQGRREEMRVASILRQFGWERRIVWDEWTKKAARVWFSPGATPQAEGSDEDGQDELFR